MQPPDPIPKAEIPEWLLKRRQEEVDNFVNHAGYDDGLPFVKAYLEKNGKEALEQRNSKGETAFHRAIDFAKTEMMDFLAAEGAKTDLVVEDLPLLHWLARRGNRVSCNWLLGRGVLPDEPGGKDMLTPLQLAAHAKCPDLLADFAKAGANVNARDSGGNTPLMVATMLAPENITTLCDNGADTSLKNNSENAALHLAICFKKRAAIAALLSRGADLQQKGSAGETALELGKARGYDEVVEEERRRRDEALAGAFTGGTQNAVAVRSFRLKHASNQ